MTASPAKVTEPIVMPFGMLTRVGLRNHVLDKRPDPHTRSSNFEGEKGPTQDMPDGQYTQSDSAGGSTSTVRMPTGYTRRRAHWRQLANTIEPCMCSGDAALTNYFDHLFFYLNRKQIARQQQPVYRPFIQDDPGEPVSEKNTHSHPVFVAIIQHLSLTFSFSTVHSIFLAHLSRLTIFFYLLSNSMFKDPFNHFHGMLQQLYPSL